MISRVLCAGLVAAAACATPVQPAKAWGGGAVAFGAALGVTTGVLLTRPYVYPYPYAYPYAYYPAPAYPAYAVPPTPVPYGYAYPPGYVAAVPAPYAAAQAQPAPATNPSLPTCGAGRFFNRLTGTCDR
jgi:hypothetical protein